jgi:hypothetical protein
MDTKKLYTIIEKLSIINVSLKDVVPAKMVGDVTFETSITEDLALDSIEIMDVLLKIREKLTSTESDVEEDIDIDKFLIYLFNAGDRGITVQSLCDFIDELS